MSRTGLFRRRRPMQRGRPVKTRLTVELLESRCVLSNLNLTPLVQVSGPSPFANCPVSDLGIPTSRNAETEPYLAVNPMNPRHLVGAWLQDAAKGIVAAVSFNGGNSWRSVAVPGTSVCSGGTFPRNSDPWVSFAPNGDVYLSLVGHDFPEFGNPNAILVSKSTDGGLTWSAPTTIVTGKSKFNDQGAITADPTNSRFAYVTWAQFSGANATTMFSRTTDGGQTWEPARRIFDSGSNNENQGHQIVVLPDGTLVNLFTQLVSTGGSGGTAHFDLNLSLIRSSDKGLTWQPDTRTPIPVAQIVPLSDTFSGLFRVPNPDGGPGIQTPIQFTDVAVDPTSGNLYTVWQDARFSNSQHYSIAFAQSTDGGFTWSAPIRINQTPDNIPVGNRQAFLPSVAVAADGSVAVTYYDLRNNTSAAGLPTDYWIVHAHPADGLTNPGSWSSENRLTPESFNMLDASLLPDGFFVGDYQGLVATGNSFGAFFTMPHGTDHNSVFFRDPPPAEDTPAALILAGDPNGDPPDSPDSRVDPNTERSPFAGVGSLRTVFQAGNAVPFVGFCSAAAIGPRHVLTAAHCVDANMNGRVDPGDDNLVEFWLNLDTDSPVDQPDAIIPATRWFIHPDAFNPGNAFFHDDIAVIELSTPLPAEVPFYQLYTGDLAGRTLHMVGYGRSGDGVNGFTTPASRTLKRVGQNVADYFEGQDDRGRPEAIELWRHDFDHPTDPSLNVFGGPSLGNDKEANLGPGDSGGPAFVLVGNNPNKADSYRIGGVMTHFDPKVGTYPLFGSVSGGTVVSGYLDWIQRILAGGGSGPAGEGSSGSGGGSEGGLSESGKHGSGPIGDPATAALAELLSVAGQPVTSSMSQPAPGPIILPTRLPPPLDSVRVDRFFAATAEREDAILFPKREEQPDALFGIDDWWLPDWAVLLGK